MDMFDQIMFEKYGQRRDPNNPTIQMQAPIDIYDAVHRIKELSDRIDVLSDPILAEAERSIEAHDGVQDIG